MPAGHDRFALELVRRVLRRPELEDLCSFEGVVNMTLLALNLSRYVNGFAKKHAEVSRLMFSVHDIDAITNGVHAATWAAPAMQGLFDRHIPGWREDNFSLRVAMIPLHEIWEAHTAAKRELLDSIHQLTGAELLKAYFP